MKYEIGNIILICYYPCIYCLKGKKHFFFFLIGQSLFPTFVSGLECRRRDVTSGGNLFTYQAHVSLKKYMFYLVVLVNADESTCCLSVELCLIFRELKCMDLVTGLKLLNMLERKENHNVLTTIMLYT